MLNISIIISDGHYLRKGYDIMYTQKISVKGSRVAAAIIDVIIINIINLFSTTILAFFMISIINSYHLSTSLVLVTILYPLSLYLVYYTIFPYFTKGRTIAKLLLGIKVVNYEYGSPSFFQLLFRNFFLLIQILSVTILLLIMPKIGFSLNMISSISFTSNILAGGLNFFICLLILIMIMATDDEQGLHDMTAKTYVVHKNFSIDQYNDVNALERRNMDWADFGEFDPASKDETETNKNSNDNDDEIELLK